MGEIIEIREDLDHGSFRIGLSVTGEERIVSLDLNKRQLFRLKVDKTLGPMACPFLRQTSNKKFVCSIHTTRPEFCCRYSCYRILVLDKNERKIGKVTSASRYFMTDDAELRSLWNLEIAGVNIQDEKRWEEYVELTLTSAGFRIIR